MILYLKVYLVYILDLWGEILFHIWCSSEALMALCYTSCDSWMLDAHTTVEPGCDEWKASSHVQIYVDRIWAKCYVNLVMKGAPDLWSLSRLVYWSPSPFLYEAKPLDTRSGHATWIEYQPRYYQYTYQYKFGEFTDAKSPWAEA